MPALDGTPGAPHPCFISGERWTFAYPLEKRLSTDPPESSWIIQDNYHQPHARKTLILKNKLAALREPWLGVQIYLKGGVRLIRTPKLGEIADAIRSSGKAIGYFHDGSTSGPPGPRHTTPASSVAHAKLAHGCLTDPDFDQQLRAARGSEIPPPSKERGT